MLADHQGYVFVDMQASRSVSIDLISALGEQPYGKNYLAPFARMIIEDPIFTEVRDRSNANFLWFIKFERSFRETEQVLQSEEGTQRDDILSALSSKDAGTDTHGTDTNLHPLFGNDKLIHKSDGRLPSSLLEETPARTNVIHVRFGKGKGG